MPACRRLPGNPAGVVGWLWLRAGSPVPDTRPVLPRPLLLGLWLRFAASGEVLCWFRSRRARRAPGSLQPLRGKGPAGTAVCFHQSVLQRGRFGSPGARSFAVLLFAQMRTCCFLVSLCTGLWSEGKVPRLGMERSSPRSKHTLPQHPPFLPQLPPLAASPSPHRVSAKCPCCHRAHFLAVVPLTPDAVPPRAPRQSPFCQGQRRAGAGGGWAGTCPPEYQSGGGVCLPRVLGTRTAGSARCKTTTPQQPGGWGGGREASPQPPGTKSQCGS